MIVFDPKGDAADAAIGCVPPTRRCTLLDFAHPTCGFNPLAVAAPADVIADYVVGALRNLFTDADIRASSDRYLRNAIIAVLANDRSASLWDAARLLSVGEEGYAYRVAVGARVRTMPEFREISTFFTSELGAQLADARSTTTAKLDAPVNKLARLLNSASIKRVLLNRSLLVDFDAIIAGAEVLVVKGALGAMGAGNTSVLMQLLMGMLDAALARQQDRMPPAERTAVALKVDEAPLVINRGFAQTIALKRSAGLETVACWQTDAQWEDRELREQLDALFAHRVYFATASARDARAAAALTMAEFSDTVRPGVEHLSALGSPGVRLHLPKHHAVVSLATPTGRQQAFIAETLPLRADPRRLAVHAARQAARGGRYLDDLSQPHWERAEPGGRERTERPQLAAELGAARCEGDAREAVVPAHARGATPRPWQVREAELRPVPAGYAELIAIDRAQSVRAAPRPATPRAHDPDAHDLEVLELIARCGHVLSTQIHRRLGGGRALTTTQRRLKRLADTGYVTRLQFHGRDGAGAPMCYRPTGTTHALLVANGRAVPPKPPAGDATAPTAEGLRRARREVHAAGWALALAAALGGQPACAAPPKRCSTYRAEACRAAWARWVPPTCGSGAGGVAHEFLRTAADGTRTEAERFETLRPHAIVEADGFDVLIELERRPAGAVAAKLERYDHFLSGWCLHTRRYGTRRDADPHVVFVCRDAAHARALARSADRVLCASRAYAGEYPDRWQYPGRARIVFAAEADIHRAIAAAYGVPHLPPDARVAARGGDPRAGAAAIQACSLPGSLTDPVPATVPGRPGGTGSKAGALRRPERSAASPSTSASRRSSSRRSASSCTSSSARRSSPAASPWRPRRRSSSPRVECR